MLFFSNALSSNVYSLSWNWNRAAEQKTSPLWTRFLNPELGLLKAAADADTFHSLEKAVSLASRQPAESRELLSEGINCKGFNPHDFDVEKIAVKDANQFGASTQIFPKEIHTEKKDWQKSEFSLYHYSNAYAEPLEGKFYSCQIVEIHDAKTRPKIVAVYNAKGEVLTPKNNSNAENNSRSSKSVDSWTKRNPPRNNTVTH